MTCWPLWWRISLLISVETTLNHRRFAKGAHRNFMKEQANFLRDRKMTIDYVANGFIQSHLIGREDAQGFQANNHCTAKYSKNNRNFLFLSKLSWTLFFWGNAKSIANIWNDISVEFANKSVLTRHEPITALADFDNISSQFVQETFGFAVFVKKA